MENSHKYGSKILVGIIFFKMILYGASQGLGFIGGIFFPSLMIGVAAGCLINMWIPSVPLFLSISCMTAAVPGSFSPCPFTLMGIVQGVLVLDSYDVGPVFTSIIFAYLTCMGFGILWKLEKSQEKKKQKTRLLSNRLLTMWKNDISYLQAPSPEADDDDDDFYRPFLQAEEDEAADTITDLRADRPKKFQATEPSEPLFRGFRSDSNF